MCVGVGEPHLVGEFMCDRVLEYWLKAPASFGFDALEFTGDILLCLRVNRECVVTTFGESGRHWVNQAE